MIVIHDAKVELSGKNLTLVLTLDKNSEKEAMRFCFERKKAPYVVDIKQKREKRSLNANAYAWVLMDKIAKEIGIDSESVYRVIIQRVGVFTEAQVSDKDADAMKKTWAHNGLGWIAVDMGSVRGVTTMHLYHGTSVYTSDQMARFIDEVVNEAKAYGIETMTPDEIAKMKDLWE